MPSARHQVGPSQARSDAIRQVEVEVELLLLLLLLRLLLLVVGCGLLVCTLQLATRWAVI